MTNSYGPTGGLGAPSLSHHHSRTITLSPSLSLHHSRALTNAIALSHWRTRITLVQSLLLYHSISRAILLVYIILFIYLSSITVIVHFMRLPTEDSPWHCVPGPMAQANKPYVWIKCSELIPRDLHRCRPNQLQENPMIYRRTSIFSYRFGFMNIQKWFRAWVVDLFFSFLFIFLFLIPSSLLNFLP